MAFLKFPRQGDSYVLANQPLSVVCCLMFFTALNGSTSGYSGRLVIRTAALLGKKTVWPCIDEGLTVEVPCDVSYYGRSSLKYPNHDCWWIVRARLRINSCNVTVVF